MRYVYLICLMLITISANSCQKRVAFNSDCPTPDHRDWTELLQLHVDSTGWVSYKGFVRDSVKLNAYLTTLSDCPPSDSWTKAEKLAYWINVYNAFTVKLIVDYYPVASIKVIKKGIPFINSVWEMEFFEIGGKSFDLSTVEHKILRKEFDEPRIHFAIVCASKSCPRLLNEAYEADKVEEQLTLQAKNFINDKTKNKIEKKQLGLSSIFKWFKGDFTQNQSLKEFIEPYSESVFQSSAKVKYLDYDWSLNGE